MLSPSLLGPPAVGSLDQFFIQWSPASPNAAELELQLIGSGRHRLRGELPPLPAGLHMPDFEASSTSDSEYSVPQTREILPGSLVQISWQGRLQRGYNLFTASAVPAVPLLSLVTAAHEVHGIAAEALEFTSRGKPMALLLDVPIR